MRKYMLALMTLASAAVVACGGDDGVSQPTVAQVDVTPGTATITALGATQQFSAVARDDQGDAITGVTFTWTSSASSVATVDSDGDVTAVDNGTATITATTSGVSGTAALTVAQAAATVAVTLSEDTITAPAGTAQATGEAWDANGNMIAGAAFTWASDNAAAATVNTSGLVTAVSDGDAVISGTANGVSAADTVTVRFTVMSVDVTPAVDTVRAGSTIQLTATPRDANGDAIVGRLVDWNSDTPANATVDNTGLVTGVSNGSATIEADVEGVLGTAQVTSWIGVTGSWSGTMTVLSGSVLCDLTLSLLEDLAGNVSGTGNFSGAGCATLTPTVTGTNNTGAVPDSVVMTLEYIAGTCIGTFNGNFDGVDQLIGIQNGCNGELVNDATSLARNDLLPAPPPTAVTAPRSATGKSLLQKPKKE